MILIFHLILEKGKGEIRGTGGIVEFDADEYFTLVLQAMKECAAEAFGEAGKHYIILTGQAEALVITDEAYSPAANAIS